MGSLSEEIMLELELSNMKEPIKGRSGVQEIQLLYSYRLPRVEPNLCVCIRTEHTCPVC